ncbi:MAG: RIP metalloprotease RseP [Alphaproteobacteria bacterium]|nr:RIP metalloprotease RseP [Alphaproteobacteria bacterium]
MSFLWEYLAPFLVLLGVLVFVHEFGHYWAARRCGVRVEVFSVGFGRELWGWTDRAGTRWKIALVPLGGYVRMFGEVDGARTLTPEEHSVSFGSKPLGQRAFIVAAGPAANFLFAILVAALMFMTYGQRHTSPVVTEVVENSAAAAAGIRAGDRFVALNGETIARFEDLQRIVRPSPGRPLETVVVRDGAEIALTVTPGVAQQTDSLGNVHEFGLLGVRGKMTETVRYGPGDALVAAVDYTWTMTATILTFVGEMIEGRRSTDELGGVLRIGHLAGEVAKIDFSAYLHFMVLLSINLGLINLFPIPLLDGGHLVFYAIEAVRGRPLGQKAQEIGFRIGLGMVVALMLFVTWNDLVYFQVVAFLERVVG